MVNVMLNKLSNSFMNILVSVQEDYNAVYTLLCLYGRNVVFSTLQYSRVCIWVSSITRISLADPQNANSQETITTNIVLGRVRVAVRLQPRNAEELVADADFADCVKLQPEVKEEDDANAARKLQINLKQRRHRNQCCQILWEIGTPRYTGSGTTWIKAQTSAFESLIHYEVGISTELAALSSQQHGASFQNKSSNDNLFQQNLGISNDLSSDPNQHSHRFLGNNSLSNTLPSQKSYKLLNVF
ncbi:uncharacterized protein LOC131255018 [Magnolia sinica]|uniref:uncharacterized protein LOC131255018 n=1 Tax=Magnolia sinica TaxID=86752 RepID=UPI0026595E74|nr:uncharacterized protein LOC131255018 [Magnolia sinica]